MATDKAQRSIFVGNIPYDVSETKLREIFSKVGPISSFRLVFDKETGKPKGYGFCEYFDIETAQSALRNLPNCDINGRPLRIGPAAGEQHFGPSSESATAQPLTSQPSNVPLTVPQSSVPNADWSDSAKVTQLIGNAVSSMPPESLAEMLRSVKYFAVTNPGEARLMLVGNPSLAYALLQALIVTRAVDVRTVPSLLHRPLSVEEKFIPPSQPQRNPYGPPNIFYDPSNVKNSSPPSAHGIDDYSYAPRDGYFPPAQIPEPYHPESGGKYSYRDCPPARKRKIRSNFDPRNLPRFSTSVLKSICSSNHGRCSVPDNEKEMIVGQLLAMSDEQIERYLPREQVELAFSIRRRP